MHGNGNDNEHGIWGGLRHGDGEIDEGQVLKPVQFRGLEFTSSSDVENGSM